MNKNARKVLYAIILFVIIFGCAFFYLMDNGYFDNTSYAFTDSKVVSSGDIKVTFLDVGQADSILIQTSNSNMLIDAGNNEDGDKLVTYFKSLGIEDFSYVVGTHPHEDHIGGLDDVIDNFDINTFYMPDAITTTKTFEDVLDSLDKKSITYQVPSIDSTFTLDDALFKVLYTGDDTKNLNNSSIVLRMDYGNVCTLFMGDATTSIEKEILDKNLDCDVLKVGHHGSNTSSSLAFLKKVSPSYAIVSVGLDNTYNLPKNDILDRISGLGAEIYRTDTSGSIIMESNGTDISFSTVKTDTNGG